MVKKIIFLIIALTILYFGYNSFSRLRYWDRSVQIFKMNSNQPFGRGGFDRGGRGSFTPNSNGERAARPDFGNIPDSVRQRSAEMQIQRQRQRPEQPQMPAQAELPDQPQTAEMPRIPGQTDSLRQQNRTGVPPTFRGRGGFEGGDRQRGGSSQRRNVRLNTVYRFLAVFAALTVLTIYIDKTLKTQRKKRKLKTIEINK